ncbi:MAG: NAD-dependent epimerase/dehydratase family protein, partial [Rhodococcus sp.]|nr:NAD-dependent epimerase/dehydratase family protein [Rhodococcus sp. (in: high G+C Gram-positive bacteria)]
DDAVVFGGTGFIGRWLVHELLATREGQVHVAARSEDSAYRLRQWLSEGPVALDRQVDRDRLAVHIFDASQIRVDQQTSATELLPTLPTSRIRDVYNAAAAFEFGMTGARARDINVGLTQAVAHLAADLPNIRRLVHVTGYRIAAHGGVAAPWDEAYRNQMYSGLGAYEASKMESDAVVRDIAARRSVPLTVINPSAVIGDSVTGQAPIQPGLAPMMIDLAQGRLRAIPGARDTWIPIVPVDYVAAFMARVPAAADAAGQDYWLLDDATPELPTLIADAADVLGVRAPRIRIPLRLLQALPSSWTGADPEALSFLSSDRYPTESARELASRWGLEFPSYSEVLAAWVRYLTAPHSAASVASK